MSFCSDNYPDDPSISDGTNLLRRIPIWHVHFDKNLGRWRPSSAAFEDDGDDDPMSVYLSSVLASENREPSAVLADHAEYSLASFTAGLARTNNQTVHPDPEPDETAHALICGDKGGSSKRAPKRQFAQNAEWIVLKPPS
jgi:hypothetical protein